MKTAIAAIAITFAIAGCASATSKNPADISYDDLDRTYRQERLKVEMEEAEKDYKKSVEAARARAQGAF